MPEYNFCPSENSPKHIVTSVHGAYPPVRPVSITVDYFGRLVPFNLPPLAPYAILAHFSRLETRPLMIPPHLPETRAEAMVNGVSGPTKEDVAYFNAHCKTHFPGTAYGDSFDTLLKSRRHDPDWTRSIRDPLYRSPYSLPGQYIPGTISGRWQGSFIVEFSHIHSYTNLIFVRPHILIPTRICCHLPRPRCLFQRLADSLFMLHSESFTVIHRASRFPWTSMKAGSKVPFCQSVVSGMKLRFVLPLVTEQRLTSF